jgi:inorganic pyrophosphatase
MGSTLKMRHSPMTLVELGSKDQESGYWNVIIETPKGCRNKFDYEPESGSFMLSKVLPSGMAFPYDFGFVPSTLAADGDPVDVLVLMDEPAFPGCRVTCRLIGVIEGEQTEEDGTTHRNDRLLAVATTSHDHREIESLKDLDKKLLDEIEHFFVTYHDTEASVFKALGRYGPHRAKRLATQGTKLYRRKHRGSKTARRNGKRC